MRSQRGEDHLRLANRMDREGIPEAGFREHPARNVLAVAAGRTAPPEIPARKVTNSQLPDHRNEQRAPLAGFDFYISSSPLGMVFARRPHLERLLGDPPTFSLPSVRGSV